MCTTNEGKMFSVGDKVKIVEPIEELAKYLDKMGEITRIHEGFALIKMDKVVSLKQPWRDEPIVSLKCLALRIDVTRGVNHV